MTPSFSCLAPFTAAGTRTRGVGLCQRSRTYRGRDGSYILHLSIEGKVMSHLQVLSLIFSLKFIYFETERERASWRGGKKGRERERERERIPSRLHTASMEPDAGFQPIKHEVRTWSVTKSWMLNQLSHPDSPNIPSILICTVIWHILKNKTTCYDQLY